MAGKAHRREFRKARTELRLARKAGRTAEVSQKFESRMLELGYAFDPYSRAWRRAKGL